MRSGCCYGKRHDGGGSVKLSLIMKYLLAWFPLVIVAIANGAIREAFFKNVLNDFRAHQLSTLTLLTLMFVYGYLMRHWLNIQHTKEALQCSVLWVAMTLAFEFGFGHWVGKKSWGELLVQYDLLSGNLWTLVIVFTAVLPFIIKYFTENLPSL